MKLSSLLLVIAFSLVAAGCTQNKVLSSSSQILFDMNQGQQFQPYESRFNFFLFLRPEDDYVAHRYTDGKAAGREKITWGTSYVEVTYNDRGPLPEAMVKRITNGDEFSYLAKLNKISTSSFIELKSAAPNTKGWIAQSGSCIVGHFSKHLKTKSNDEHAYTNVAVRLNACTRMVATAENIASSFGLLSKDEARTLKKMYSSQGPINQIFGFPQGSPEVSGTWPNVAPQFKIRGTRNSITQVTFAFEGKITRSKCDGNVITSIGTLSSGIWEIECSNGEYAEGTWTTTKKAKSFMAIGQDNNQQTMQFQILF